MSRPRYWTEEKMLEAAHEWATVHGSFPTSRKWRHSSSTPPVHPSERYVSKTFGSWSAFRERYEASLTTKGTLRRRHEAWEESEVIDAFQKFSETYGRQPVVSDTRSNDSMLPSLSAVVRIFGSWNTGMRAAGFLAVPRGLTRKAVSKYLPLPRERDS